MDKTKALQNLLKGKATKKEIELLKRLLASGRFQLAGMLPSRLSSLAAATR